MANYKKLTDVKTIERELQNGVHKLNVNDENVYWRNRETGEAVSCKTEYALKAIGKDYLPEGRSLASVFTEAILELKVDPKKPKRRFPIDYRV